VFEPLLIRVILKEQPTLRIFIDRLHNTMLRFIF
jgi:hypothetical protein